MNGLILIDKPSGCTSHDVVNRWRKIANTKRAGHLGTLDPMATGLLAIVTGTATRLAQFVSTCEKTYEAEIEFGKTSDTYDIEGELHETGAVAPPEEVILQALQSFQGAFLQTPPPVSAKKIKGVPAYKLARQALPVDLAPVEVTVRCIQPLAVRSGVIEVRITCSTGTYIRSIAHDLGQKLGCGAVLRRLRRTRVGNWDVAQARSLDALRELAVEFRLSEALIRAPEMLPDMPTEYVDESVALHIRQGRDFRTSPFSVPHGAPFVKAVSRSGEIVAIGALRMPNLYHPSTVL